MKLKPGVKVNGISPEILLAIMAAQEVYRKHGAEFVITSGLDGKHSDKSFHYTGYAVDLRSRDLPSPPAIAEDIRSALGADYDVVVESDHIHIEYDQKT